MLAALLGALAWLGFGAEAQAGKTHVVRVVSDLENFRMYFEPKRIRIEPGDTVVWVNEEDVDHNVLTYPDGYPAGAEAVQSPYLSKKGQRWSRTFTQSGTYDYHCLPHLIMGMYGTVVVGDPANAVSHKPTAAEVSQYRDLMLEYFTQDDLADLSEQRP